MTRPADGSRAAPFRPALAVSVLAAVFACTPPAEAAPVFSQKPNPINNASVNDEHANGRQYADDFTLSAPATVRSATWRGISFDDNMPVYPMRFNLYIYNDNGSGLPNTASVLSHTTVNFQSFNVTDTGVNLGAFDIYEYRANLTPVALASGTRYWFSPWAITFTDPFDDFAWATGFTNAGAAEKLDFNQPFTTSFFGPFYFELDDAVVPEPTGLVLLGTVALRLLVRRKRPVAR